MGGVAETGHRRFQVALGINQEVGGDHHLFTALDSVEYLYVVVAACAKLYFTRLKQPLLELHQHNAPMHESARPDSKAGLKLDEVAIAMRVEAAQARVFVERLYASAMVSPLGILLVAWLIFRVSGGLYAAIWTGVIIAVELLIVNLRGRYLRALADGRDGRACVRALMAVGGVVGLVWGASVWFLWAQDQFLVYIADLCVLVGVSGVTMVVLSPLRWSNALFSWGMLLPVLMHIVVTRNPIGLEIGAGWLVMVAVQTGYARQLRRELALQLDASERNAALAGLLRQAGDDLQAVNAQVAAKNTELELAMEKLNRLVTTDQLTGAYTRRYVFEQMERKAAAKARHGTPLSVITMRATSVAQPAPFNPNSGKPYLPKIKT